MSSSEIVSLIISIIALIASVIAVWTSYLAPSKTRSSSVAPTLIIYKITEGTTHWWAPSFNLGISFFNLGTLSDIIFDVRLVVKIKEENNPGNNSVNESIIEYFYPRYLVDFPVFNKLKFKRFEWINTAVIREWKPFILNGKSEKHLHLILEHHTWKRFEKAKLEIGLEVFTSQTKKWMPQQKYELTIDSRHFDELCALTPRNPELSGIREGDINASLIEWSVDKYSDNPD